MIGSDKSCPEDGAKAYIVPWSCPIEFATEAIAMRSLRTIGILYESNRIESKPRKHGGCDTKIFFCHGHVNSHTRIILRHATIKRFYELCPRSSRNETKRHTYRNETNRNNMQTIPIPCQKNNNNNNNDKNNI
mmetsp:Transcript_4895/g.14155  ORF Transcript_4895/g.14155 Transcript_4895/m.14155 type:complete len:133 (-) Transcript_4895:2-400(-)